ncbi:hypothetical protein SEA_TRAX_130 [Gordonia phage Trax]|uniref:Uncharacterized protein n=1 Tax=Gordonia phage Trax TaxID=2591121 RepID=A0A515MH71_9CAUD|nr:hypothetical protein L3Y20_gp102 [Gordonia phage Trax]QDM56010.1 hypothetical protein SEA_TRAX_130 [Gordonia phage Trax]
MNREFEIVNLPAHRRPADLGRGFVLPIVLACGVACGLPGFRCCALVAP